MARPNNLPQQLTSFIGREGALADVQELLRSTRLVTLTGAGGSGKTRLAIQVASTSQAIFPDGAWLVELGSLSEGRLVAPAVAAALGLREEPEIPIIDLLTTYLQPLRLLLVLDNCEHLVQSCAALASHLLRNCPELTILATSRRLLGIEGEAGYQVPPMTVPAPTDHYRAEELMRFEAVELFAERAKLRRNSFVLDAHNVEQAASLCRRLDGLPLAIELAAARTGVLSIEQIADRLDERFKLLTSSNESTLPRHRTLQALMDWSYDLLSEDERSLLRALSVFAGVFSLDVVLAVTGGALDQFAAIDLLEQLVDRSLVMAETGSTETYYRLLETISQYAWERAGLAGEHDILRERHLRWYTELAEKSEAQLVSEQQAEWLESLDREHDNLRAALEWSIGTAQATSNSELDAEHRFLGLRLAAALIWFWYFRGHIREGRYWLEAAIERNVPLQQDGIAAKALSGAGVLAYLQSDLAAALQRLEVGVTTWRALKDIRGTAFACTFLGRVLARKGDPNGLKLGEESVALFKHINDRWGLALSLDFLGEEAREAGNEEQAALMHDESLALYRALGHSWGVALELSHFAQVSVRQGDLPAARKRMEQALQIQREVGDKWMWAWTMYNLADVVRKEGDIRRATDLFSESRQLFEEVGELVGLTGALLAIAELAFEQGYTSAAEHPAKESEQLARGLGDRWKLAGSLLLQGQLALAAGEVERAGDLFREALTLARTQGNVPLVLRCLVAFAHLAEASGQHETALLLLGPVEASQGQAPEARSNIEKVHHQAEAALGGRAREVMRQARSIQLADAVALALHETPSRVQSERTGAAVRGVRGEPHPAGLADLTQREAEVLSLIAEGLTDAQIAEHLVLSVRTVQAHIRSIYSKLGITTRSAATRYAMKHGLV